MLNEEMIKEFIETNKEVLDKLKDSNIKLDVINPQPDMEYISEFFDGVTKESKEKFREFLTEIENDNENVRYIIKELYEINQEVKSVKENQTKKQLIDYLNNKINPELIFCAGKCKNEFFVIAEIGNVVSISKV